MSVTTRVWLAVLDSSPTDSPPWRQTSNANRPERAALKKLTVFINANSDEEAEEDSRVDAIIAKSAKNPRAIKACAGRENGVSQPFLNGRR